MSDCNTLHNEGGQLKSGKYRINPNDGMGEFDVFCDMSLREGGWTVIQRRVSNATSFSRNRPEYNVGFGEYNGNFWLGLEKIKRITDTGTYELYVGLESFLTASPLAWAEYGSFSLGTDDSDYTLSISSYNAASTAADALGDSNAKKFSTPDEDNDSSGTDCAGVYQAGWWYNNCYKANLNGIYYWDGELPDVTVPDGIIWNEWLNGKPLKTVVMAIRPA